MACVLCSASVAHADTDTTLRQKLIETAAQIHARERTLERAELDIKRFYAQSAFLSLEIDRSRVASSYALAGLARLARAPSALRLVGGAGVEVARGGLVLESATATLAREAESMRARLARLAELKGYIGAHRQILTQTRAALVREHKNVTRLLSVRPHAGGASPPASPSVSPDARTPGGLVAGGDASGDALALPPAFLLKPVQGAMARDFARESADAGGIRFRTRAGAQVIAPGSGRVVFAGPFRSYADVLIIDTAGGYHIVLAGLSRLGVRAGDTVIAGEPVGRVSASSLSMELRHKKATIDPVPFFQEGR